MEQPETGRASGGHGGNQVRIGWTGEHDAAKTIGPMPASEVIPRAHPGVIIVFGGTHPSLLPKEGAWEIWGLNAIRPEWTKDIEWDRWFNLHRYEHLQRDWKYGVDAECAWAQANPKIPFYCLDDWSGRLPNPRLFPRYFDLEGGRDDYHCSSVDLMITMAISLGFERISLHGIDMTVPHVEPISARACAEYWIGFAEARGIKVQADQTCDLLSQWFMLKSNQIYGWDDVHIVQWLERQPGPEDRPPLSHVHA